jgi:VanZ family protein
MKMGSKVRGVRAGLAFISDFEFRIAGFRFQIVDCRLANAKESPRRKMKSFLKYWLPVVIWLCFIFIGSTDLMSAEQTSRIIEPFLRWLKPDISLETIAQVQFVVRKCAHVTEYAILAILLWRAICRGTNLRMKLLLLTTSVWIAATFVAAIDEYHQSFVISRTASLIDLMIDSCGALIGAAGYYRLSRVKAL